MKARILPVAAAQGIATALQASGRAARARGAYVGSSIGALVPALWDGSGLVPVGWTLPFGLVLESGGARAAVIGTDSFAAGKSEFAGAVDALPSDWASGELGQAIGLGSGR